MRGPKGRIASPVDVSEAVLSALRIGRRTPNARVVKQFQRLVEELLPLGGVRYAVSRPFSDFFSLSRLLPLT